MMCTNMKKDVKKYSKNDENNFLMTSDEWLNCFQTIH